MMKVVCWSLLLILSLGWLPSTALSATTTSTASLELGEVNAFILPRILQAHRRLNGSRTFHRERVAAPSNDLAALEVLLDTSAPISEVDPQFLSVTIDAGQIRSNWSGIALRARRIINMAFALYPCMLRVGGTSADFMIFNRTTEHQLHSGFEETNYTMTTGQWDEVNQFVEVVGWEFVFGLNGLLRSNGVWDSSNAALLMSYSNSKGYKVQWELGNEPDLWATHVSPQDHAKDFMVLQELVTREKPLESQIVGPDVASSTGYFAQLIETLPQGFFSATTYHQYYGNGHTGTLPEFYDIDKLDSFIHEAVFFQSATELLQPQASVWLGETSSLYDGGTPHLSDSYVAGFMWLDKLGVAAAVGHKRVFRQAFIGGFCSLLDRNQDPLPDYWLSVLYKRLVGTKVIFVKGSLEHGRQLRVYAHCAKSPYPAGSVVLLLLNLNFSAVSADLLNSELVSSERDVFWLSPPAGNLTSTSVQLNGLTLKLVDDRDLPELEPEEQPASPSLSLPAISFGFIVFKDANVKACL
jgi:heparanase 1